MSQPSVGLPIINAGQALMNAGQQMRRRRKMPSDSTQLGLEQLLPEDPTPRPVLDKIKQAQAKNKALRAAKKGKK